MTPRATMRLQLHKGFTFADAAALVPYIAGLGISHVYSSPILKATPGSMHGYDVVDPTVVNPELGGEQGFRDFVAVLRDAGLGLIVDIVPNHMAVGGIGNPWWTDVLKYGRASRYAGYFDIDWDDRGGKVLAPFLGKPYGQALEDGEITLARDASGEPVIRYFDNDFPIDPTDYAHITECEIESFDPRTPSGRSLLHALLERQHYRLAWWALAGDEINWRRFFDINGLAGLRIEVPEVFEAVHALLFRLFDEGLIDGFRVDHVDGLSDPPGYCRRLRERVGDQAYLVVEKILGAGESLPTDWGVDGTSGYDFMNEVSALQHDASSAEALGQLWHKLTGRAANFEDEEVLARTEILQGNFDAQLQAVTDALHRVGQTELRTRDLSAAKIKTGLVALLSHFPVYRGYDAGSKRSQMDQLAFSKALKAAKAHSPEALHPVLDQLDLWLGGEAGDKVANTRFQQLSAPVAAKSVEDTAFYRYGRLLSRNDVGFDAGRLGGSVADFHRACLNRLATFPASMLATATHDHKRGEDLRARLAVISEMPDQWAEFLAQCGAVESDAPDPADTIMLYQMIVGAWPLALDTSDDAGRQELAERLAGWQQKALREAKLRTSWTSPNDDYEARAKNFLFGLLARGSGFLPIASEFIRQIAAAGAVNGLVQTVMKATVPGMPDFFQGTEFWDFSLVDPDNRRPVDYSARRDALAARPMPVDCLESWRDGRIKQAIINKLLDLRQRAPELFARGDYSPLEVGDERFVAFTRSLEGSVVMVVAPRLAHTLLRDSEQIRLDPQHLGDIAVSLPESLTGRMLAPLFTTGQPIECRPSVPVRPLLADFPMAVLYSSEPS